MQRFKEYPMKILIVIPSFTECIGGPVSMIMSLSKYYKLAGHEVTIATTNWNCEEVIDIPVNIFHEHENYKIIYFDFFQSNIRLLNQFCFSLPLFRFFQKNIQEYDIVHTHSVFLFPTFAAAYWAHKKGVPYFITPHGILQKELLLKNGLIKRLYSNIIEKRSFKYATGIHCLTEYEKQSLQDLDFCTDHSFVIPNGIDSSVYNDIQNNFFQIHFPKHNEKKKIVFLSRINWKKGLDTLIPSIARLIEFRDDIHLFLAGPDNENYLETVNTLIQQYNVGEYITYIGVLKGKEIHSFLKSADVFVLPSYSEGFSMAIVESLAAGTPVVITPHCNFDDVETFRAGIIATKTPENISAAIVDILTQQQEMSINAFHLANTHYQWDTLTMSLLEKYLNTKKDHHV